ncbi:MAG: aminotransferase class I/II-fold pyridoxal phosphate-dependent enzyme, partial [Planctomycetes bacterium]|nr:aminotransferase class I/II-fold pyridoxal phosphate-dependent enzyme [Planctomycetota bacterium]
MKANSRVAAIPLSETIALDTRAKELIAAGRDVLNLSAGEPDFDAPQVVRDAARAAVDGGQVRYTPAPGRKNLRDAIAKHLQDTRGVAFTGDEVIVCHSAKHALSGSLLGLIDPGDEVLLCLPAWVSYVEQIKFAGGTPVGAKPRDDIGPDWDALEAAITPRTKGIIWNSPSNPSGYVATRAETERLVAFAERHDLWILSDEIYRRLTY